MSFRVEQQGVLEEFRGKLILQAKRSNVLDPDCDEFLALSGGTLTDSVYIAKRRNPTGELILISIAIGIEDAVEIINPAPADIEEYIVDQGNLFHDGAPPTFIQGMEKTAAAESGFESFRLQHGFTRSTCPKKGKLSYDNRYETYMKD